MQFVNWSENDSVNIDSIDAQHQRMLKITNHLYSLLDSKDNAIVNQAFVDLDEYLKEHFHNEETYMLENKFPGYISHKLEHDRYYNKIKKYKIAIEKGEMRINLEIVNSLKKWFFNHLEINDKKLGHFLVEKGIK